jgi:hypothetical protein
MPATIVYGNKWLQRVMDAYCRIFIRMPIYYSSKESNNYIRGLGTTDVFNMFLTATIMKHPIHLTQI